MQNLTVRIKVADAGVKYGDIAKKLGTSPQYLSRIMAKELSPVWRHRILDAVDSLQAEGKVKK